MNSILATLAGFAISISAAAPGPQTPTQPDPKPPARPTQAAPPAPKPAPKQVSPPDLSKEPTLYVVAYAHLDTQWRWAYPQTIQEFIANTLHDNFALFEKYPNYVFNFSGSRRYQMMKEYFPADYEKLRKYISGGRWFPCGSSVDENDANVPSGESLIRHVLYGNHYFRSEFGIASDEYMLPDCFGFPASLPQVLAHCGVKGFSTQKLTWNAAVPIPFKVGIWEGPDGSSVIAALDPGAYVGEVKENLATSNAWTQRIKANGDKSGVFTDYHYYGTGDQGGAPKESSVDMVEKSIAAKGDISVIGGRADLMFNAITPAMREKLPRYKGELMLTQHSAGSISSEAYMKRWNRKNELLADAAERASVGAMLLGARAYPAKKIEDAWYLVLGSQMHDILPGTSLPKAYDFSWNDELLAANQFSAVLQDSAGAVISSLDTQATGTPVVVYNPTSTEREDVVEAEVPAPSGMAKGVKVTGPDGKAAPAQILETTPNSARVAFLAKAPPVGFASYGVELTADAAPAASSPLKVSERQLENENYTVKLDDNGDVSSIHDKKANRELLAAPARLGLYYENPSAWPAWNQDWEDRQKPAKAFAGGEGGVTFKVVENGPARIAVEVTRPAEGSTFTQRIRLAAGDAAPRIEFDTDIQWLSRERSLRASFPLTVSNPTATYDIQAGVIERPNSHEKEYEYPFHQWMDLSDAKGGYGVSVMCDSKYASDKPDDHTLRLTLLHTPGTRGGYPDQGSQDLGRHHVLYALYGHTGDWRQGATPLQASRLNQPLIPFRSTQHPGTLGKSFSLAHISNPAVSISAIKKAEDSGEVIVRLRELTGADAKGVKVALAKPILSAREVDGQERPLGPATVQNGELVTDIHGLGLRAFALKLEDGPVMAKKAGIPLSLPFDTDAVSTNANRADGAFDDKGSTFPAEQLPASITAEGVTFNLGPTADGQKNALACRAQEIQLPAGDFDTLYLLAAAITDTDTQITIGDTPIPWTVQAWTGYIGQWDHRLWSGDVPDASFNWVHDITGLEPGYVKQDPVAWFCSHHHNEQGDVYYQYCYLFKYTLNLPAGAKFIKLPDNFQVKVFAATAAKVGPARAVAAAPLFDTLKDHIQDAPRVVVGAGPFTDATEVKIEPGMYWRASAFRYTLDGADPTLQSMPYTGPITLSAPATVKVAMFDRDGKSGQVASTKVQVDDRTPPTIKTISAMGASANVLIGFSEPLDISAADASNFTIEPKVAISRSGFTLDRKSVGLTLAQPLETSRTYKFTVAGVKDASPAHNQIKQVTMDVTAQGPVYSLDEMKPEQRGTSIRGVPGLPIKARDAWTINMFVKTDKQPPNHTIFAGFGKCGESSDGAARYLCKFSTGIHFWSHNRDAESTTKLDLNAWQMLTATYDGRTLRIYKNGKKIGESALQLTDDENIVNITPKDPWDNRYQFSGDIRAFTIWSAALGEDSLAALMNGAPK